MPSRVSENQNDDRSGRSRLLLRQRTAEDHDLIAPAGPAQAPKVVRKTSQKAPRRERLSRDQRASQLEWF